MIPWTVKFRDLDVRPEEVRAVSYKLTHEGRILSFFDERGGEVFACPLEAAICWLPTLPQASDLRGPVSSVPSAPSGPPHAGGDSRPSIEQQAMAAAARSGQLEGRLVASA
ncbi:hypothetical protein [Nonomuraea recticatena]|uniref:Uncharacterized protein n=1 Tax=Nonomuraea recticatena TaxID=46178 RepID=A0ABN3RPM1_9ACTN